MPEPKHHNTIVCEDLDTGKPISVCYDCGCSGEELNTYSTCEQYRIATHQEEAMKFMYPEFCKE